jgi:hypothetical protein
MDIFTDSEAMALAKALSDVDAIIDLRSGEQRNIKLVHMSNRMCRAESTLESIRKLLKLPWGTTSEELIAHIQEAKRE